MSLSSIAIEQREKEAKKLKSFLAIGLISSLALHIGVLSLNIGNLTKKTAEVKNEPLEIEIVDLPEPQKPSPPAKDSLQVSNRVASSESGSIALSSTPARKLQDSPPLSKPVKVAPSKPAIAPKKSPISVAPAKIKSSPISQQKPVQTAKATVTQPAPVAKLTAPSEIATPSKPVITPSPLVAASPKPAPTQKAPVPSPISSQPETNQKLRNLLTSTRNTQQPNSTSTASNPSTLSDRQTSIANNLRQRGKGTIDGAASSSRTSTGSNSSDSLSNSTGATGSNSAASASSIGTGNNPRGGSNNGTGNGSRTSMGNNPSGGSNSLRGNGSSIGANRESGSNVATGTQNRPRTAQPESNSNANSSSGGLACRSCSKPKYPDKARRRGLEGKAEISVDVDSKGNVTNVRLARSSGHSELDKAALQEARRWKFKAPNGGARDISAKVDFAIEGSERSRKLRERRKRRQAEQRRSTPTTQTADAPLPNRRVRNNPVTQNASSPRRQTTTSRRRIDTLPPRRTGERQRPIATQQASSQTRLRQSLRRQRPTSNRATPSSQTKLRQSLRQSRQNPQPVASPND